MNRREAGFLLLTSHLGDPDRRPLTTAQLRDLAGRIQSLEKPAEDRELEPGDLIRLGYGRSMAEHICRLLSDEALLKYYLQKGRASGCVPVTRVSEDYPHILRQRLGLDSPGCLWCKGDQTLLNTPAVSLVGSRDLLEPNREFARAVGIHAARQGLTLVSGNARGADRTAQDACLEAGGRVISIVADDLCRQPLRENILYVSEDGYAEPFSAQRAISRNRCIHALGQVVFVAQSALEKGGTWDGTVKNLRKGISPVLCFQDGSEASMELEQLGAWLISLEQLSAFEDLPQSETLFDR